MNILAAFEARVAAHPDRVAIVDRNGHATTYGALASRSEMLSHAWQAAGLRRGDRVLIARGVDADLYANLAALWRIGAVAVLPEPALGLAGVRHAVAAVRPVAVLTAGMYRVLPLFVGALRGLPLRLRQKPRGGTVPLADLPVEAPALISFTSGSTGLPKAIVRSHGFLAAQDRAVAPLIAPGEDAEIDLVAFPVFVVANLGQGITSVLPNWRLSAPGTVRARDIARHAARHGVTRMLLNPAIVETLAATRLPAAVHTVFTGGGPVFPDVVEVLRRSNPALRIVSVYGSTEAEPIAHLDALEVGADDMAAMRGGAGLLAGHVADGTRVRIVDHEIQVAGDHVVSGYFDPARDASTKVRDEHGTLWHRTGDAAHLAEDGRLWLFGRLEGRVAEHWPFAVEVPARIWPGVRRVALAQIDGQAVLAVEGDDRHAYDWKQSASRLGIDKVIALPAIPMDRRHGSKVDRSALDALLAARA